MKKVAAGMIAGFALAVSLSAHAEDVQSVVGRVIEGTLPLRIDGTKADLDAIVVDGTSYIPVRAAGTLFGYQIDYVYGEVVMNKISSGAAGSSGASADSGTASGSGQNVADSVSENVDYTVKSSFLTLNSIKVRVKDRNGELYVPAALFDKYLSNDGTTLTIKLPNQPAVSFSAYQPYEPGVDGYSDGLERPTIYVKLSALQLKAVVKGNNMTLEKK